MPAATPLPDVLPAVPAPTGPLAADPEGGSATLPRATALTALVVLMTVGVLYVGRDVFVPLALAVLLGFVLDPVVTRLRRWRMPRPLAVSVVMVCTVAVLGGVSIFVGSQVVQLSKDIPTYQQTIQKKLRALRPAHFGGALWERASRMIEVVDGELGALDRSARQPVAAARVVVEPARRSALQQVGDAVRPILEPMATAGIVLVFVIFMLLGRDDMRDRLLRLLGGELHHTTDALGEAAQRVSRYLGTQLLVNLFGFGLPLAVGLTLIGVPGALLWGLLAAVMRFVPFVGLLIAAVFPLTMAFAIDPGWSMLLWTAGLILLLEVVIVYLVEPLVYGASTGLSAFSILLAAVFWTALWGPVGLVLATPLTVCLAVMGRHLPHLQWLDVLLGSAPVFDPPTRLYQRLLAGDVEEAIELAEEQVSADGLAGFYSLAGVPALCLAARDHTRVASVEHRHRVSTGMEALIRSLREEHPAAPEQAAPVLCIGLRREMDTLAADMLAHALGVTEVGARALPASVVSAEHIHALDLAGVRVVCLSSFSASPQAQIRYVARRLKRLDPALCVLVAAWDAPPSLLAPGMAERLGVDAMAQALEEAAAHVRGALGRAVRGDGKQAPMPPDDARRVQALADSGALDAAMREPLDRAAQRVADIFDTPLAMVSLVDETRLVWHGAAGLDDEAEAGRESPREASLCGHVVALGRTLVVDDLARDPRFAAHPGLQTAGWRFYAGAPLRTASGAVIGALCVVDRQPRGLNRAERRLLEAMADDLMRTVTEATRQRLADAARTPSSPTAQAPVSPPSAEAAFGAA